MQSSKRKILSNKIYLYLTEFFAGMSVMAVELGASRLLAPYFSSSQIVWTIIIGTIMIAMALGNIYGGRAADKNPDPDKLYGRIIVAAIWIALIPVLGKYVIIGISAVMIFSVNHMFLIWAAFAACMVVFVFPLFLLGTVTPSLVKFTIDDLGDSGKTVGMLNAFNTVGSIIGTFVPTFVTIPAVGTSITFLIFAGILLLLAILYFASPREGGEKAPKNPKNTVKVTAGILIFLVCCFFGKSDSFAFWESDLTYEGESVYNYLQVSEDEKRVYLSTNVLFGVQSVYEKDGELTGMYYDYALAAPYMAGVWQKRELDVLILGMGTGTYATECKRYFEENNYVDFRGINVTGVEIDEDITRLARDYFHLSEDIPVVTYDGRAYLNAIDQTYDVIMVDAYQDITIPFQMSSVEFFTLVKEHLKPDGVMVVNMNMRGQNDGEGITFALSQTISKVFPNCYQVNVPGTSNREFFASENEEFYDRMVNIALNVDVNLKRIDHMSKVIMNMTPYEFVLGPNGEDDYMVMTDDKAPVELLGMKVIDEMIAQEMSYYKEIYQKDGLTGLLNAFSY
ncbi:MAG: fused MFS/spermidine synthase [Lachnospiraceae bacterium]|nr:fused MFS/spermidine synthase [Lachnospiraceae bacterium]